MYAPQAYITLDAEKAAQAVALVEDLEDHEDVQNVYADFDVTDDTAS